jgi:glutathione-regulated potassium-efflux system ancillary protein KefG
MKVLVLYAHPAQQHSRANVALAETARQTRDVSFVDLYATYPRFDLDVDKEQQRLLEHDAIVLQFPLMWYSTPSLLKEWQDLVLEYGFAYGENGDRLKGKLWLMAITAGSAQSSYGPKGHNILGLRQLLAPLEATARLCQMAFLPPYTLFEALKAPDIDSLSAHVGGYQKLLKALRDENFDHAAAQKMELMFADTIPLLGQGDRA